MCGPFAVVSHSCVGRSVSLSSISSHACVVGPRQYVVKAPLLWWRALVGRVRGLSAPSGCWRPRARPDPDGIAGLSFGSVASRLGLENSSSLPGPLLPFWTSDVGGGSNTLPGPFSASAGTDGSIRAVVALPIPGSIAVCTTSLVEVATCSARAGKDVDNDGWQLSGASVIDDSPRSMPAPTVGATGAPVGGVRIVGAASGHKGIEVDNRTVVYPSLAVWAGHVCASSLRSLSVRVLFVK